MTSLIESDDMGMLERFEDLDFAMDLVHVLRVDASSLLDQPLWQLLYPI